MIKVHKNLYFVTSSVACSQFLALLSLFSFQGAGFPTFSKVRLKCSIYWQNTSIQTQNLVWSFLCLLSFSKESKWWAQVDSNHRPHDYQSCALASWAMGPSSAQASYRSFPSYDENSFTSLCLLFLANPLALGFARIWVYTFVYPLN